MKVIGAVKPPFPINAFSIPIFESRGLHYIQVIENNMIVDFEKVKINESQILLCSNVQSTRKFAGEVFCYLTDSNKMFTGTLNTIRDSLYELLFSNSINPVAKILISSMCYLNGKTSCLIKECNDYFRKEGINGDFNLSEYLSHTQETIDVNTISKQLKKCKEISSKYKQISGADCISFFGEDVYINEIKIQIEKSIADKTTDYFKTILDVYGKEAILKYISIDKNENIKSFFRVLLYTNSYIEEIDDALLVNISSDLKIKESVMYIDFKVENNLMEVPVIDESNIDFNTLNSILLKVNEIKERHRNDK